jgi:hypothetical protein
MPTFNIFRGDAQPRRQVDHLPPANPEPGDTFVVTINRKDVSVRVAADTMSYHATLGYVPALVAELVTALDAAGSDEYTPEFGEVTWSSGVNDDGDATHVVATGPEDGKPVTITVSTTDAGAFSVSVSTTTAGSAGTNEKQSVTIPTATSGGTFALTFAGQTTGAIAYNAAAATVQTALEALSNIASGDVAVTGASPEWTVEFSGAYAATNVPAMTGSGTSLTGAATLSIATTTHGAGSLNEIFEFTHTGATETYTVSMGSPVSGIVFSGSIAVGSEPGGGEFANNFARALSAADGTTIAADEGASFIVSGLEGGVYRVEIAGTWGGRDFSLNLAPPSGVYFNLSRASDGTVSIDQVQQGSSSGVDEIQTVTILGGPDGGTFPLTFQGQTTAGIAFDAAAADVKTALEALSNVTTVTVTKSGTTYAVTFTDPGDQDLQQMTGSAASLTGGNVLVSTTQASVAAKNEKQQVSLTNNPTGGTFTLTWDPGAGDETTGNIAHDASASTVQTALEGLTTPTAGDFSVTGSDGGPWVLEFKGTYAATNVNEMDGSGTNLTGSGTQSFTLSSDTAPTGPNWFDNAENWSLGTAPADDETLVFQDSDVDCLHGLSNASITPERIVIKSTYTGRIGLPRWTGDYYEYRDTELTIGTNGDGSNDVLTIDIGEGDGNGSGLVRINTGTKQTALNVHRAAASTDGSVPSITWRGTHADNAVRVYRGAVGIGYFDGQSATVSDLLVGWIDSQDNDSAVVVGSSVTLGDILKTGGSLVTHSSADLLEQSAGTTHLMGSAAVTVIDSCGGTVYSSTSGTLGQLLTVTGVTQANPAVVTTSAAHGLTTGDKIRIASVSGMTELNQNEYFVLVVNSTTVSLVGVDATGFTAYVSGGVAGKIGSVRLSGDAVLDFSGSLVARSVAVAVELVGDSSHVVDTAKRVTTSTYLTGEFATHYLHTTRYPELGSHVLFVRSDGG